MILLALTPAGVRCHYCQRYKLVEVIVADHYIPLVRGGTNDRSNLVLACRNCDQNKGPMTGDEYLAVIDDPKARKAMVREINARLRLRSTVGPLLDT